MLRELADVIVRRLWIIFERSWSLGKAKEDWEKANVTPVFRKGKEEDLGSYRPIPGSSQSLGRVRGNLTHVYEYLMGWEEVQKTETDSASQFPVKAQEMMGVN